MELFLHVTQTEDDKDAQSRQSLGDNSVPTLAETDGGFSEMKTFLPLTINKNDVRGR